MPQNKTFYFSIFILYNGVLVSWAYKKQPVTALHSTASEITALHKGATKTVLFHSFLQSIGFPLSSASPTYEDNTGTIKLSEKIASLTQFITMQLKFPGLMNII
jgi:hypothetical protein